jgi:transcriptional regulator with GAF, ATPase, and Fis domain
LLESELFGHEKGSFTGATQQRKGRFELADGGTLFLDEIGELAPEMQAKLLRVLQEKEFERVGGNKTLRVDVRLIAATNRDLFQAAQVGEFREDLYYRLNSFPIQLPALRDRPEDIPPLVRSYSQRFSQEMGREISEIRPQVMQRLQHYAWPGNVRELKNVIERAVITSTGTTLRIDESMLQQREARVRASDSKTLAEVEYDHIVMTLKRCNWKISGGGGAAERLGLNPSTLRGRLRKLDISKDSVG